MRRYGWEPDGEIPQAWSATLRQLSGLVTSG
jgi:hypothetical protein